MASHLSWVEMLVNVLLNWVPRPLTIAMIATEILAAINPYSMAVLPTYALDRLSRYEHTLWRQARQIVLTLESLRRRKQQPVMGQLLFMLIVPPIVGVVTYAIMRLISTSDEDIKGRTAGQRRD